MKRSGRFVTATECLQALVDLFFPPLCLLCGRTITAARREHVCAACLEHLQFHGGAVCSRCGVMFASDRGGDHLCGACIQQQPFFDRARALGPYEGLLRTAIQQFKYTKKNVLAAAMGNLLARYGAGLLHGQQYDVILSVPLHVRRLRTRGFNQSLRLARVIGKAWGIKVDASSLKRITWEKPQTSLPLRARKKNVKGAFAYQGPDLTDNHILLVDDVVTSGSTANECARILKTHGALIVDVLALARTV